MWATSSAFLDAVRFSHSRTAIVDIYQGGLQQNATPIPIVDGSVTVDAASKVRRQLSLVVDTSALTVDDADALYDPMGSELHVQVGIQFPNGVGELVPVGVFRYESDEQNVLSKQLRITAPDRAKGMLDNRFVWPMPSQYGQFAGHEILRLINETYPGLAVVDETGSLEYAPNVTWEEHRWDACIDLATSMGAEVFFDPEGTARIRTIPELTDNPVWLVDASPTGVLKDGSRSKSREHTYSGIIVRGERADGSLPVQWDTWDMDPASPTYADGPFGRKAAFYQSPLITTQSQAFYAGAKLLPRYTAMQRQLSLSIASNPALTAGDVIDVRFPDGRVERHIIDRLTIPLGVGGDMEIDTRSERPDDTGS